MAITGYRSPVDLGLGQVPQATDPELFDELTEVYNAIHLLNQYLDQLRVVAEGGGGSGQDPSDSMPFNRFYVAPALVNITVGDIVSPTPITGSNGIVKGALANDRTSTAPTSNFTGVALTSATIGEDVRVGIGPASLTIPGALSGKTLYAYGSFSTTGNRVDDGGIYLSNPGPKTIVGIGTVYPMPVAICPRDGFAIFGQYLDV